MPSSELDTECWARSSSLSKIERRRSNCVRTLLSRSSWTLCANTALSSRRTRALSTRNAVHVSAALAHTDDNDIDTCINVKQQYVTIINGRFVLNILSDKIKINNNINKCRNPASCEIAAWAASLIGGGLFLLVMR